MDFLLPDFLQLSYRPDLDLLLLRWTRPATPEEHRAGYRAALDLARQHQAGRWLIDLRRRGLAEPKDFQWVLHTFRPELQAALPSVTRRFAYLATPYHAEILQPRLTQFEGEAPASASTAVRVFTEEQPAQQWLLG